MRYAGLTDDPETRKQAHGNPSDWWQRSFSAENAARQWEKDMLAKGYKGDTGGKGWRYGYTYSVTSNTRE
ncbi:MAG: hypothetical protein M0038_18620 [Pseudomonadota bacterium]|jgi:hypothetical protein|nr:hypothetical protein [Pseudomonadota bacterium]